MMEGGDNFWMFYGTTSYPVFHISDDLRKVGMFNTSFEMENETDVEINTW